MESVLGNLVSSIVNCVGNHCNTEELPKLSDNTIKYLYLCTIKPGTDIMNKGMKYGTKTEVLGLASRTDCEMHCVQYDEAISELKAKGYRMPMPLEENSNLLAARGGSRRRRGRRSTRRRY
jgi:hypothetical protein